MSKPNAETLPGSGGTKTVEDVQDVHEAAQQQRAGAPKCGQREVANVEAALHGDLPQRIRLVPRGDFEDPGRAGLGLNSSLLASCATPSRAASTSSGISPPSRCGGMRPSDAGIRHSDVGASSAVAQRPGMGAGRLWSDFEVPLGDSQAIEPHPRQP